MERLVEVYYLVRFPFGDQRLGQTFETIRSARAWGNKNSKILQSTYRILEVTEAVVFDSAEKGGP